MPLLLVRLARPLMRRAPRLSLRLYRAAIAYAVGVGAAWEEWRDSGRPEVEAAFLDFLDA